MMNSCPNCGWHSWTKEANLTDQEAAELDRIVVHHRSIRKGAQLHRAGSKLESINLVHSGFFKSVISQEDGVEQIVSFSLPHDPVGLEAIAVGRHQCTAVALEDSSVCGAPYGALMELCDRIPKLQHHLHRLLASELRSAENVMLLLSNMSAQVRLAKFLLRLSARFAERGYSPRKLRLPMSRREAK